MIKRDWDGQCFAFDHEGQEWVPITQAQYDALQAAIDAGRLTEETSATALEAFRHWRDTCGLPAERSVELVYAEGVQRGYREGEAAAEARGDRLVRLLGVDAVKLAPHQRRVLAMVADGMGYEQIGVAMRQPKPLTERCIKYHFQTAAGVLGIGTVELRRRLREGTV